MFTAIRNCVRLSSQFYVKSNHDIKKLAAASHCKHVIARENHTSDNKSESHIIQMRGLDFETTEEDIIGYFRPLSITPVKIHLPKDISGRTSGVCEVEFANLADAVQAMRKRTAYMGNRYIRLTHKQSLDVSKETGILETLSFMSVNDLNCQMVSGVSTVGNYVVRMRNVAPRITESTIYSFFVPVDVRPLSIRRVYDEDGCRTDEVDLIFGSKDDVVKAMCKNNSRLGHRNVELVFAEEEDASRKTEQSSNA